jgi:transposase
VTSASPHSTELPADLADVRRKLEQLAADGHTVALIELVVALLVQMRDKNNALSARLASALRELYGRKSQKISTAQLLLLFAELGAEVPEGAAAAAESPDPSTETTEQPPEQGLVPQPPEPPKPPPRRGAGRAPLPKDLRRETRIVAVPETERTCPQCGADKKCIGHRTSEILEFLPAQFKIIEEQREKLACPRCPEQGVTTAATEKVMDRGRPGPGLLANIVVEKFDDAMPLYRQMQRYARSGVTLAASTLGEWAASALDILAPVAKRIDECVLSAFYVRADDTGMKVLDRDHPKGVRRGHIWAFVGADLVSFLYAPDWAATHPAARLQGFTGYLQGDGYAGYAAMLRNADSRETIVPEHRRLGCGMHIRSKFEKATRAGDARAAVALAYFKAIYRIEAECKEENLSADDRAERRQELSLPLVDDLYSWIHELHRSLIPATPIYVATQYAINQEAAWRLCFTDGRFEIDNGEVERQLRRVALGRKNYLFAGSDKGAQRLAVGYTIFGSCRIHGVNPLAWATDVIGKLQAGWPRSRLDELLPDAWAKRSPEGATAADAGAS